MSQTYHLGMLYRNHLWLVGDGLLLGLPAALKKLRNILFTIQKKRVAETCFRKEIPNGTYESRLRRHAFSISGFP